MWTLDERTGDRAAAEQGRGKANPFLVGEPDDLDRKRQPLPAPVQVRDAGNRRDQSERAVPFAGVTHRIIVRAQHQARQARPVALIAAADISDRVEMRAHARLDHPGQDEIGGDLVFGRKENPRQLLWRLRDRSELVDPADDFIAEQELPRAAARHFYIAHALPVRRLPCRACSIDTISMPADHAARLSLVAAPIRLTSRQMRKSTFNSDLQGPFRS